MKDILKIMRFDFLTAKPIAIVPALIIIVICFALSLFFSPVICSYITFGAMLFMIPLQSIADKSEFHKLYGILPVKRINITKARFWYIFLLYFTSEILELVLAVISFHLKLYKVLPNQNSEMMQLVHNGFEDSRLMLLMIVGMFTFLCLTFSYMEMMGQIHGRENEFKIIIITLISLTVLLIGFLTLSNYEIIPTINLPSLPDTVHGILIFGAVLNIIMCGICFIFGEITAHKLAKREL